MVQESKRKNKKSTKGKVVTGIIAGTLICMTAIPAFANNHSDWGFEFDFNNDYYQTTPERVKEDDSYVYMKCLSSRSSGDSYDAHTWGWNSDLNIMFESSGAYTFYEDSEIKMINYIYENDGDYAFIKARHSGDGEGKFTGLWSPDSI